MRGFIKLTETPHVDGCSVGEAEDDFRRPVEAGLNVRVHLAVGVAGAAKIDDFDRTAATLLQQHIFLSIKNLIGKLFTCLLEGSVNRKFPHSKSAAPQLVGAPGRAQQSAATYRLQITMNDVLVVQQAQALDDGVAEASYQAQAEALVVVLLD